MSLFLSDIQILNITVHYTINDRINTAGNMENLHKMTVPGGTIAAHIF